MNFGVAYYNGVRYSVFEVTQMKTINQIFTENPTLVQEIVLELVMEREETGVVLSSEELTKEIVNRYESRSRVTS